MNLSRKVWLILGAIIIIAAIIIVGVVYFRQAGERDVLNNRLSEAETRLPVLTASRDEQENQLASAESLLEASQAQFPESVESIEYGEYLFEIADDCNVNLASLKFPKPTDKKIGAVTYSVVSLSLPISGTLEDIFDFIDTIRTDERFASADVKSVYMDVAGSSAIVSLDIYGYKR